MSTRDPAKRIPKSLGTETKLFGTYTLTDLAVALFPGVLVILLTQVVFPSTQVGGYDLRPWALPAASGAIVFGVLFVYLTPAYTTSLDWLFTVIGFYRRPSDLTHDEAKQHTQIERVHPERGAIERTDGAFIALVQVTSPTMALATTDEWAAKATAFENFCNTTVEFPIQIFSTTRPFPVDTYLSQYESRLSDPDVKANPRLGELIEHYIEWYETDLDDRRMTIRDHYVVVPVTPAEVRFDRESLSQKLTGIPVLGVFIRVWFAPRVEEQREAMFEALDDRVRRVEGGLRGIDGCSANRVSAPDAAQLVGEFWAGESRAYDDLRRVFRTRPLVGRAK